MRTLTADHNSSPYGWYWWRKIIAEECRRIENLRSGDYMRRSTATGAPERQEDQDRKYEPKQF